MVNNIDTDRATNRRINPIAARLAERTSDAYSFDNYGEARWTACCSMLLKRGYSEREAEAILRSKWTRWAGDMATNIGRKYGHVRATDLAAFLDTMPPAQRAADVAQLVIETDFEESL